MSTRCLIAVEDADKTLRSIYVHFDGYPDGAGLTLITHYTTKERIEALLALGPLSGLGDKLSNDDPEPNARDVCAAYHRDYGEDYQKPNVWQNSTEILAKANKRFWVEYVYLFRGGQWYVADAYRPDGWKLVSEVLEEENKNEN